MHKPIEETLIASQHSTNPGTRIGQNTTPGSLPFSNNQPRFKNLGRLGEGGICDVSRLYDSILQRETALKHLKPNFSTHTEALLRFQYEAQVTAQLEHPNIIPVHEFYVQADTQSINMKLVEGDTLTNYIHQLGEARLDHLDKILEILLKVLDAIGFAHNRGIIHRDLKPGNIMIGQFGEVYLMDWGIVKRYRSGDDHPHDIKLPDHLADLKQYEHGVIGTPAYMSPEQANGKTDQLGPASDLYAIGAILYFCLTGHPPYAAEATLQQAQQGSIQPVNEAHYIPDGILKIVYKAMSRHPEGRYPSAMDMHQAIEDFVHGKHLPIQHYAAGQTITHIGDCQQTAYFIQEGYCVTYTGSANNRTIIRELKPGDVFGELSILSKRLRTTAVEAVTDTTVLEITPEFLAHDLGLNDWFGSLFERVIERFLSVEQQLDKPTL